MDLSIRNQRESCDDCNANAPTQQPEPLILTPSLTYSFEQICADYFHIGVFSYLTVVVHFNGWICIYFLKANEVNSIKLQNIFRDLFVADGVSEELSSNGGPQFMAESFQQFLKLWVVRHRLPSVPYPQSNGCAEGMAKRIIHNNISLDGSLNNERAAQAILQHPNTPLQDIGLSPAQILLHHQFPDGIPSDPSHYKLHKDWIITAEQREKALSKCNPLLVEKYNCKVRQLLPCGAGTNVVVQGTD